MKDDFCMFHPIMKSLYSIIQTSSNAMFTKGFLQCSVPSKGKYDNFVKKREEILVTSLKTNLVDNESK